MKDRKLIGGPRHGEPAPNEITHKIIHVPYTICEWHTAHYVYDADLDNYVYMGNSSPDTDI